jgi:hypothetical protein
MRIIRIWKLLLQIKLVLEFLMKMVVVILDRLIRREGERKGKIANPN